MVTGIPPVGVTVVVVPQCFPGRQPFSLQLHIRPQSFLSLLQQPPCLCVVPCTSNTLTPLSFSLITTIQDPAALLQPQKIFPNPQKNPWTPLNRHGPFCPSLHSTPVCVFSVPIPASRHAQGKPLCWPLPSITENAWVKVRGRKEDREEEKEKKQEKRRNSSPQMVLGIPVLACNKWFFLLTITDRAHGLWLLFSKKCAVLFFFFSPERLAAF